ncbi:deoxyribonuclease V [Wenzhouxiangella marina]|uniref:Endonuclease V n=1 Tax=Wenzhouxiangella marina TaxID=1579979 RepID=A0A0K0XSQ7_9GAMM|nr:deoxyribonuclease V [Wenzhouxiangella marina]AKS40734.1 Endonuclease V [Wenzhouxiangella marina]MBB6087607.1 deoxyribonuclease V [Wenzhouxiangella marina]
MAPEGASLTREWADQQRRLADKVIEQDQLPQPLRTVAGVDAAFPERGRVTRAAAVLLSFPELEPLEQAVVEQATTLPYIPGFLSFRELPAIRKALDGLSATPDLVLCDGQGRAHPRRLGIACHLGVATGLATIGVGKSRLCGRFDAPDSGKGSCQPLIDGEEVIGQVLRTRDGVRPVFVSVGHRVSLETAVELVLACTPRYRLPEPIRQADRLAGAY